MCIPPLKIFQPNQHQAFALRVPSFGLDSFRNYTWFLWVCQNSMAELSAFCRVRNYYYYCSETIYDCGDATFRRTFLYTFFSITSSQTLNFFVFALLYGRSSQTFVLENDIFVGRYFFYNSTPFDRRINNM